MKDLKPVNGLKAAGKVASAFLPIPPLGLVALTSGGGVVAALSHKLSPILAGFIVVGSLLAVAGIVCVARELRHPSWGELAIRKPPAPKAAVVLVKSTLVAPAPKQLAGVVVPKRAIER